MAVLLLWRGSDDRISGPVALRGNGPWGRGRGRRCRCAGGRIRRRGPGDLGTRRTGLSRRAQLGAVAGATGGGGFPHRAWGRRYSHGLCRRVRSGRAGGSAAGGIRRLAGAVATGGGISRAARGRGCGPRLRAPSLRRRVAGGGDRSRGVVAARGGCWDYSALRYAGRGGWLGQGLHGARRAVRRRRCGTQLAPCGSQHRQPAHHAGQQVGEVSLPRRWHPSTGARLWTRSRR